MRILLALSLVLGLAGPVDAILVEGRINTSIPADFVPNMDLRGEEFSLRSFDVVAGNSLSGFSFPFNSERPVNVSNTSFIQSRGSVTFQGETFPLTVITGPLTFDVQPFLLREGPPIPPPPGSTFERRTFVGESPFTMTGQLSFAGQTVALEGSGILTVHALALSLPPDPTARYDEISYDFTPIPEPGTLVLFGTAAGLGALYGLRKRRGDR
jgi:hypothetical protein